MAVNRSRIVSGWTAGTVGLLLVLAICLTPLGAWGGELKILDQTELTRAVRIVRQPAKVVVVLSSGAPENSEIALKNIDGVQSDRRGTPASPESFTFENVPEGIWRIAADPKSIKSVRIE
ncbi:MAG: hypothetical protein K1X83_09250 [Oligoflexia bacterium]|nr:hypothetical protein [Oligoflexia bacterium]